MPHRVASLSLPLQRIEEFLVTVVPFNLLPKSVIKEVAKEILIEYYPKGTAILEETSLISFLYLIYSGIVKIERERVEYRSEGDYIGGINLIKEEKGYKAMAIEDVVCYLIPKGTFLKLCDKYSIFKEHFETRIKPLAHQLRKQKPLVSHLTVKLSDLIKQPPVTCKKETSIIAAAQQMTKYKVGSIVVIDEGNKPLGIVTKTDLTQKVVARNLDFKKPISHIMTSSIVGVDKEASYFEALLQMAKYNCHHLCVLDNRHLIGVISLHDLILLQGVNLISFVTEIERKKTIGGLAELIANIDKVIKVLFNEGASPMVIRKLTSEFVDRILCRLFSSLKCSSCCLMGLGELGRMEQRWLLPLKLCLIYKGDFSINQFREVFKKSGFTAHKDSVFLNSVEKLNIHFKKWLENKEVDKICAFLDRRRIGGEERIFKEIEAIAFLKDQILSLLYEHISKINLPLGFVRDQVLLTSGDFAKGLNLTEISEMVVHGVRFLSFLKEIRETNTFDRLDVLREKKILSEEKVTEFKEIYNFLNHFRIKFEAEWLDPGIFSNQEKILLEDCLRSLKKFKDFLAKAS